jgi:4-nitrophenyl phosphatase
MSRFDPDLVRGLILDMDGVLWRGSQPIGNLSAIFEQIEKLKLRVVLASNNAMPSLSAFQEKLSLFGVTLSLEQIISSSVVTAHYLKKLFPSGGPVYIIGESGLVETLAEHGFTFAEDGNILAVVVGLDRYISYDKLRKATLFVRSGVPFIGTNPDRTYPAPEGLIPGAGSLIAALQASTDVEPLIMGKPAPNIFEVCLERLGLSAKETLCVGDRLETDIAGGQSLGMPTALVLSGVTTYQQAIQWSPQLDWIGQNLSELVFNTLAGNIRSNGKS